MAILRSLFMFEYHFLFLYLPSGVLKYYIFYYAENYISADQYNVLFKGNYYVQKVPASWTAILYYVGATSGILVAPGLKNQIKNKK